MKISRQGINLIKSFESCRLTAYKAVKTEKYFSIGYGHYGADVQPNMSISQMQADLLLAKDLEKFEKKVDKYNSIYHFTQAEFDSLVSFCYNVGNIDGLTNNGKRTKSEIATKLLSYNKSGGVPLKGLIRRRQAEHDMFLSDKSNSEIAREVLAGKWGVGEDRKKRLTEAGYDYNSVQAEVNKLRHSS